MLTCRHVRARLSDLRDGEIGGVYGAYLRFHSTVCPPCRRVRRSLERTMSLLSSLRDEPVLDDSASAGEPPATVR